MSRKSPKASSSRKKPRTFAQALAAAERKTKPNKALVELMRNAAPWDTMDYGPAVTVGYGADAENAKLCAANSAAKPSNPKDALGILKAPFSTVSAPVVAELGIAMFEGALKYGRHNYRAIGVRGSVYYDALMRHVTAWWEGEDLDPDSSDDPELRLHHIAKAIATLVVLRDAMILNKFIDDRPPKSPAGWQTALNKRVKALLAKYPTPVPPYIEGDERMRPQPSAALAYAKLCQQAIDDPESVKVN